MTPDKASDSYCVFEYLYRDASNYKQWGHTLLRGCAEPEDDEAIRGSLSDWDNFIPEAVGLEPLQSRFEECGDYPSVDDHPWHEFIALRKATAEDCQTLSCHCNKSELIKRFCSVTEWDVRESEYFGLLRSGIG